MAIKQEYRFLITGIGNTLRGDDGIGAYICSKIETLDLEGVKTITVQQLDSDLLDEFLEADHIILADAFVEGKPVHFYPVKPDESPLVSSSHHMSAALLMQMAKLVYNRELSIMICAVGGFDFDIKEGLSARARRNADEAVRTICDWIAKNR
ncbi:MAG: hydrogenase maturation protease [Chitinophagaceae bacterium]|nr:hydrogenase maturation protease [Chitinophagaceae bacterium]